MINVTRSGQENICLQRIFAFESQSMSNALVAAQTSTARHHYRMRNLILTITTAAVAQNLIRPASSFSRKSLKTWRKERVNEALKFFINEVALGLTADSIACDCRFKMSQRNVVKLSLH